MKNLIQQGLALRELLRERILVLDGAMGTMLQQENLTAADFGGRASRRLQRKSRSSRGRTWFSGFIANIWKPARTSSRRIPLAARRSFSPSTDLAIAPAKSAAAPPSSLASGRRILATLRSRASSPARWGPRRRPSASPAASRSRSFARIISSRPAASSKAAPIFCCSKPARTRATSKPASWRFNDLSREIGQPIPLMISVDDRSRWARCSPAKDIEALWASLDHVELLSLGLNCATGPEFMTDHIRTLQSLTSRFVSCYPNAGLPNEEGRYRRNSHFAHRAA